jgi:hypothetical protein
MKSMAGPGSTARRSAEAAVLCDMAGEESTCKEWRRGLYRHIGRSGECGGSRM